MPAGPSDLYADDHFLAEYRLNQVHGGLDLGYALDRFSESELAIRAGYLETNRWVGSPFYCLPSRKAQCDPGSLCDGPLRLPVIPRRGITSSFRKEAG